MDQKNLLQASKKRLLLSWYIDFLFFMTIWGGLTYIIDVDGIAPFWVPYVVFVVVRAVSFKFVGSIGFSFLSINKDDLTVTETTLNKENWLTMLLGVLFVLEGTKQLVRWTQTFVSQPAFGFFPDESTQIIMHLMFGGISILAGYWFLKLDIRGFIAGIGVATLNVISDSLSWKLWDPIIEQMVLKRKEVQGLPVREGELEMMQALMPEGLIAFAIACIIAMLFTYPRFKISKNQ